MSEKTIDREAQLLIQLGKMGNKLQETQSLLRDLAERHLSVSSELKLLRMVARERDDMNELLKSFVECIDTAIVSGDWKVDGACDPDSILQNAKRIII